MRIRKNLKLSSTSSSSSEDATLHAHVCQLNQSPWDLIPFDSHSYSQFEYDDSCFTAAATAAVNGDSIGAVESVASMMDIDEQAKLEDMAAIAMMELVDDSAKGSAKVVTTNNCGGSSYNKKPVTVPARGSCSRPNAIKARAVGFKKQTVTGSGSSTNAYEFYYYSGFGPTWSTKRRGDRIGREANKNNIVQNFPALQRSDDDLVTTIITPSATITDVVVGSDNNNNNNRTMEENVKKFDYDLNLIAEEEDDDDVGDDYEKKKRMKKPVKARSLKSLM